MDPLVRTVLWQQFGATIDMLENALLACPDTLWKECLWRDTDTPEFASFWHISYHTLFWLDLYLTGVREEEFTPPAPFAWTEPDEIAMPAQPYTREELHTYLVSLRQKCQTITSELSDERAHQQVSYPWMEGHTKSFLELLLYTMRHVQEHAAQLSLFLGQHTVENVPDWVPQAQPN